MIRRPPISTRTYTLFPYTTLFRSLNMRALLPSEGAPFRPETVKNYEAGIKADLIDRHLRLNAAAYKSDYTNIQRTISNPCAGNTLALCTLVENAATATIKGFEVEATASVAWLNLSGFVSVTDATYDKFITHDGTDLSGRQFAMVQKTT